MQPLKNESEDELDSVDEKSIGDFKQWHLLLAVCPIFGHDHPWTAFNRDTRDVTVMKRQSKLFTTHFLEIHEHRPTNSLLAGNEREDFEQTIDALISSLECLVNGEKLHAQAEAATALDPDLDFDLVRRCPNLLALSSLSQDGPLEHYSQYLHLSQNAKSFKKTCKEVGRFLQRLEKLRTDKEAASTRHAPEGVSRLRKEAQPKDRFSYTLWSRSKSLFESLVTSLKPCDRMQAERNERFSGHKAMLHLKSAEDHQCEGRNPPEVCIALTACEDEGIWHQIHCMLSPSVAPSRSPTHVTHISDICKTAKIAHDRNRLFKIEHHGTGSFTDVSDRHFDRATYLNAHPTIALSALLSNKILRDQYRFYPCDKKILAFGLAHSLLQFSEGPWMQTLWTHDQVFFMYGTETKTVYNIHQPWISCTISDPVPPMDSLDEAHPFPVILSFAKLLLELENGEEFNPDRGSHGKTPSLVASLWEYCRVWNSRLLDDDYSQAVDACLNFVRYLRQHQEDDLQTTQEQAVRDVILARIVIPLERRVDMAQKSSWGHQNLNLHDLLPTLKPIIPASPPTEVSSHPQQALQQPNVSTMSFDYISKTVDDRMVYNRKDKPICVAVLDTGFDYAHADFQQPRTKHFVVARGDQSNPEVSEDAQCDRIVGCRDFCRPDLGGHFNSGVVHNSSSEKGDKDENLDDVPDLDGHGTNVAGILLRIAPRATLLIARVSLGKNSGDVPYDQERFKSPQPETVAKAIEWALRKGADIINLSLGFRNYSWERLDILRHALQTASNQKVVVFAATSNEGSHEPVAWPASDRNLAIGVHSCTDTGGLRSEFTAAPSPHGVNFMVVGERILSQRLTSRGGGFEPCSGSSFATPVAAAIGALVLAFTRQRVCYQNRLRAGKIILDDLHSTSGMIKVLEAISTRIESNYWSLRTRMFWATYQPSSEDPTEDEEDARQHAWRIIQDALRP